MSKETEMELEELSAPYGEPALPVNEVNLMMEEPVEEDYGRVTERPESTDVDFVVIRAFTWNGQKFSTGPHTLPQDEYDAMMYDINVRTDRQVFIAPE